MEYVTVYHNGQGLMIAPEVAAQFNLRPFQRMSTPLFWEVLAASCAWQIASIHIEMAKESK